MSFKNKIYSLVLLTSVVSGPTVISKEESTRCVESKHALRELETRVFDEKNVAGSDKALRDLEAEKLKLEAQKSIADTFKNIHSQREEFLKRLNPTNPNSFYSKSMNAKTAVQETQKQIISNYILTSITSSISAILEKDNFLETDDKDILNSPEWKSSKSSYEKFKILANGNPYKYIKSRCEALGLKGTPNDPCTNFTDIEEKSVLTIFMQTNQDMVGDVTNNFFEAYDIANSEKSNIDDALRKIQKEKITNYVDVDNLTKERTILISALLEKNKSNGLLDRENLSTFFKVNSIDPQTDTFTSNPMKSRAPSSNIDYSLDNIVKMEKDFEEAKECFTKKAFGIDIRCTGDKSISNFFNKINDLSFSKVNYPDNAEQNLENNKEVSKFNANSLVSGIAKGELNSLRLLGRDLSNNQKFDQMKEICSSLAPFDSPRFVQSLWDCVDKLNSENKSNSGIAKKISDIDLKLLNLNKELTTHRDLAKKKYGDLVKYAAATAKEYCNDSPSEYKQSCVGSENNITTLVFGDDKFLTNLDNIEWNMSGKKETEEILSNVNQKCTPLVTKARQKSAANSQLKTGITTKSDATIENLCTFAKNDLNNLNTRTPSAKQKEFRRNFNTHYDRSSGKMVSTKKTGIGTMIAKSVGTSLINNGLPLYLQNSSFKNNLPYQTNMALYQKNYLYIMNNPQYWGTGLFTGYGVSSSLNGYATSGYYNFSN